MSNSNMMGLLYEMGMGLDALSAFMTVFQEDMPAELRQYLHGDYVVSSHAVH